MLPVLLFLSELLLLFVLSKSLTNHLFALFHKLTKSKKISTYIIGLLFLPGTLIHELAHAVMAMILLVPVGKMELWPQLHEKGIKLGSIRIAKTDPIRRFLIGAGPFIFGTSLIIGTFFYAVQNELFGNPLFVVVIISAVFEIGNNMFSSKKDMEGALELALVIVVLIAIFYFAGLRVPNIHPEILFSNEIFLEVIKKANLFLGAPIGIDIIVIALLKLARTNYREKPL